jgi:hypothetical protein
MAIPIIATPTYELTLPSTKKKIKYRPFLVKEEKMLLLAMESKDPKQIQSTSKEVIKNCTFGEVDVTTSPPFDIEYILLQLRIHSVGEKVSTKLKCSKCETPNAVEIDLKSIGVSESTNHTNTIKLTDKMGVIMRYPNMGDDELLQTANADEKDDPIKNAEMSMKLIASCIEVIYDGDKTYPTKNFSKEEINEFIENLSQGMFQKLIAFFQDMPAIKHNLQFKCEKCEHENNITLRGIQDFFT